MTVIRILLAVTLITNRQKFWALPRTLQSKISL